MAKSISQLLAENPYHQAPSLLEALKAFEHIELTEEETMEAVLAAKQRKASILEYNQLQEIVEANRRKLVSTKWSADQFAAFAEHQAPKLFEWSFQLDPINQPVFSLICFYLAEDPQFFTQAELLGVANPSFKKGLLLAGNPGCGKTAMMHLFARNQKQCYRMENAKRIASKFADVGELAFKEFLQPEKNALNDPSVFFQPFTGVCIDDIGTEDIKNHYGNRTSVIVDLIELLYAKGATGAMLHGTTNFDGEQMEEYYGKRVRSRMREIFNFILLPGGDRRK